MSQRFRTPETVESVSPNLIPMIDIMFLMLLFFMLGADMSQREMEDVILPQADMVKEDENTRDVDKRTTVNIYHSGHIDCPVHNSHGICREENHWLTGIRGKEYTRETLPFELQVEAALDPEEGGDKATGKPLSKRKVMIRADQSAPYGFIQRVIEDCAKAGLYKLEVGAAKPPAAK